MLSTAFSRGFDLQHPVVSAPMAGVAGPALARAVTAAGGLGLLGVGTTGDVSPAKLTAQADQARVDDRVSFGIITWLADSQPQLFEAILQTRPYVVALSFGDPRPLAAPIAQSGAKLICQVQDERSAEQALEAGADALVAQGNEAGGHTGGIGTLSLLQAVLAVAEPARVPVLASGGIATGAALAAVLAGGAAGAWIGTRFYVTAESEAQAEAKQRIIEADGGSTVYTQAFDIASGQPWPAHLAGRALRNAFTDRWHGHERDLTAAPPEQRAEVKAELASARASHDFRTAPIWAGQGAGSITSSPSAADVLAELVRDAEHALRAGSAVLGSPG